MLGLHRRIPLGARPATVGAAGECALQHAKLSRIPSYKDRQSRPTDREVPAAQTSVQALRLLRMVAMTTSAPCLSLSPRFRLGAAGRFLCGAVIAAAAIGVQADPPSQAVEAAVDAQTPSRWNLSPEVDATRTRLTPPGAPALTPDGRQMTELAGVNYRWWLTRGPAAMGVGVGTLGYVRPALDGRPEPLALTGTAPTFSVGLRYRTSMHSAVYADAHGTRGLAPEVEGLYVNTKVGMEWKPAKNTLGFEHGTIGVHFDSGYRLSFRPRKGGLGVYLRGQF